VRERVQASRIASKDSKQKRKNQKPKKRTTARRSAVFKSASWYGNAAMSIGVSAKRKLLSLTLKVCDAPTIAGAACSVLHDGLLSRSTYCGGSKSQGEVS
jgi:hypothetical protein